MNDTVQVVLIIYMVFSILMSGIFIPTEIFSHLIWYQYFIRKEIRPRFVNKNLFGKFLGVISLILMLFPAIFIFLIQICAIIWYFMKKIYALGNKKPKEKDTSGKSENAWKI